ncbi:MAG: hypothetical protein A2451_12820 [Bdellovibrionales bacterium RIFOXYC2_FULL_39_8]|nr:MAG: hypothetical protein A2451_12820 [Bdellovibrionales bacterium RIFOXYC2_FULL_39_8]
MDGSEVTVGAYGKTVYDSKRGILYALNKKNNRLDAFDSIYSNSAEFLSLEPSRKINPDIDNHLLVDYKVDEKKNTVYFLYRPLSSADKNLKVLYFENADGLNNLVRADKFIVASEIVTKIVSPDSEFEYGEGRYDNYFLLETDLNSGKIFITQNGRLEIFSSVEDIERQYGEGQLAQVKPLKVILGSLANFGTPTALYFYVPEEQSHASYLLLSTVGRVSGVVGFDERVLDASTRDIYPIFNLTSEQNGLTNPQKIAIGNLSE